MIGPKLAQVFVHNKFTIFSMGGSKVVHPIFFIPGATDLQLRCRVWPTRVKKLACYDKRVAMDQLAVEKKRTWQYGRAIESIQNHITSV